MESFVPVGEVGYEADIVEGGLAQLAAAAADPADGHKSVAVAGDGDGGVAGEVFLRQEAAAYVVCVGVGGEAKMRAFGYFTTSAII